MLFEVNLPLVTKREIVPPPPQGHVWQGDGESTPPESSKATSDGRPTVRHILFGSSLQQSVLLVTDVRYLMRTPLNIQFVPPPDTKLDDAFGPPPNSTVTHVDFPQYQATVSLSRKDHGFCQTERIKHDREWL